MAGHVRKRRLGKVLVLCTAAASSGCGAFFCQRGDAQAKIYPGVMQGRCSESFAPRPALGKFGIDQLPSRVAALGPFGAAYFCAVYAIALCFAVPATPLTLTAGYLFGFPAGFLLAITAGGVSGCICFMLSRIMRPSISRLISHNQAYGRINRAVELEGFKIIFLLRLSPVVPFSILSYACGLSQVAFPAFCLANILGFMPCTAALVWAATHMRSVMESGGVLPVPVYCGAAVVTAALLYLATTVAKNALDAADRHAAEKNGTQTP